MSRLSNLHSDTTTATDRVVTLTGTAITLNPELHANRLLRLPTGEAANAVTITLPRAMGTGDKYEIVNTLARSSGNLVVNVSASALITGVNFSFNTSAVATDESVFFMTNADTITLNNTTTGGLGGDRITLVDMSSALWVAEVYSHTSGDNATCFTT